MDDDRIIDYSGLVNKPPIEEIYYMDLVNKPDILDDEALAHHGILNQRWGIRRYQNPDGSLTELGKRRYANALSKREKKIAKRIERAKKREAKKAEKWEKQKKKILNDPALIAKYQDKLSTSEIKQAVERLRSMDDIYTLRNSKLEKGKQAAQNILSYGEVANSMITFLNSNAGKAARGALGFGTEDIFNFNKKKESPLDQEISEWKKKAELSKYQKQYRENVAWVPKKNGNNGNNNNRRRNNRRRNRH
jgi:ATP-dependent Lon protease